jgi:hypothetical protein
MTLYFENDTKEKEKERFSIEWIHFGIYILQYHNGNKVPTMP